MDNIIDTLEARGFIEAMTAPELREGVEKPISLYAGFDPTADSLHLGNLVGIMALAWFQKAGHRVYALAGGATGLIGDPSGKDKERPLLTPETIKGNLAGIEGNLRQVLADDATLVDNYDWFSKIGYIELLRDIGKHFRMGPMLGKDMVRRRLDSEEGLSYTEFSYQLLQAYDFLHLLDEHNVTLQVGGSDQWGNITAGVELIRKLRSKTTYGLTFPLLTRSDGKKFGKSEGGAIWLSPKLVSPYEFYQYLFGTTDDDVIKLMRMLTFLPMGEIREWERRMAQPGYVANEAQKVLATEVTKIVHGEEGVQAALKVTSQMQPGAAAATLDAPTLEALAKDMPSIKVTCDQVVDQKVIELLVLSKLSASKGEARKLIRNGGVYLNNQKVSDENSSLEHADLIEGRLLLLGVGKKKKVILHVS